MARGWESKSVESQIEDAARRPDPPRLTEEQRERNAKRNSLLLSRTRILRDLETARHPRHQQVLRAALEHLDGKLAELDG